MNKSICKYYQGEDAFPFAHSDVMDKLWYGKKMFFETN